MPVWTSGIAKAPGILNTSLISLWCTKDLEKKRLWEQRYKRYDTRWEREHDAHDGYYCDASKWRRHARYAGCYCDVSCWCRFGTNTPTTSFLDFWRLEHAQATQEHTEQPRTQLGSVFFVDANIVLYFKTAKFVRNIDIINNLTN